MSGLVVRLLFTHSFCWDSQCHPFHTIVKVVWVLETPTFGSAHPVAVL